MLGSTHPEANAYLKNLLILSFSFLLVYSAFSSLQNLESSILPSVCQDCYDGTAGSCQNVFNKTCTSKEQFTCDSKCPNGYAECLSPVGSWSLGVIYFVFTFSCIFGSTFVEKFGSRTCLKIGFSGVFVYCLANIIVSIYPSNKEVAIRILIPASVILGITAAFVWTAQGIYVTRSATGYAYCKNICSFKVMGLFNGIFFGIYQLSQVVGNLAASVFLRRMEWTKTALFSLYAAASFSGMLLIFFLKPLDDTCRRHIEEEKKCVSEATSLVKSTSNISRRKTSKESIHEVLDLFLDKRMVVIIPLSIFSGFEQAFAWGDFTSDFVKPALGEHAIGYVMAAFGVANVVGSLGLGELSDKFGRWFTLMKCSCILALGYIMLFLMELRFCEGNWTFLLICSAILGLGDAAFTTIGMAILGDVFNDNPGPAFAHFQMVKSATISIQFLFKQDINIHSKLLLMIFSTIFGIVGFNVFKMNRYLTN